MIRKGQRSDLKVILQLVKELASFEKENNAVTAKLEDYYNAYDDELIDIIVAEHDGEVIGMALYYKTFSTWKGLMMYLEDFYVKPAYRSKGIGQQIFDRFIEESKNQNAKIVKWQVLNWNTKAIDFYLRNKATIEKQWFNAKIIF